MSRSKSIGTLKFNSESQILNLKIYKQMFNTNNNTKNGPHVAFLERKKKLCRSNMNHNYFLQKQHKDPNKNKKELPSF